MGGKALTKTQQNVFDFICQFTKESGFPPSYRDIAKQFGFSSEGSVRTHLELLEKKGFIQRQGTARGIKILKEIRQYIPIVGQIAAGGPRLAIEEYVGTVNDINQLKYKDGRIALTIRGDSMKNAGILDGDIAIIQTGTSVANGQIGAVLIEGEATLKRIYYGQDSIHLQPENDDYSPIYITRQHYDAQIVGKYIALVRKN